MFTINKEKLQFRFRKVVPMLELLERSTNEDGRDKAVVRLGASVISLETKDDGVIVSWEDQNGELRLKRLIEDPIFAAGAVHAAAHDMRDVLGRKAYLKKAPLLTQPKTGVVRLDLDGAASLTAERQTPDESLTLNVYAENWHEVGTFATRLECDYIAQALPELVAFTGLPE